MKVTDRQGFVEAFLSPERFLRVDQIIVGIFREPDVVAGHGSTTVSTDVEAVREFSVPVSVEGSVVPGRYDFETIVVASLWERTASGIRELRSGVFCDSGSVWIRGEEEQEVTESLGPVRVALKFVFPTTVQPGETITGEARSCS